MSSSSSEAGDKRKQCEDGDDKDRKGEGIIVSHVVQIPENVDDEVKDLERRATLAATRYMLLSNKSLHLRFDDSPTSTALAASAQKYAALMENDCALLNLREALKDQKLAALLDAKTTTQFTIFNAVFAALEEFAANSSDFEGQQSYMQQGPAGRTTTLEQLAVMRKRLGSAKILDVIASMSPSSSSSSDSDAETVAKAKR